MRKVNLEVLIETYQENYGQLVKSGDKAKLEYPVLYVLHVKLSDPKRGKTINSSNFLDMCKLTWQDVSTKKDSFHKENGGLYLYILLLDLYVRKYGEPETVARFPGNIETLFVNTLLLSIVKDLMLEINEDDRIKAKSL